jgi:hypothetical protein
MRWIIYDLTPYPKSLEAFCKRMDLYEDGNLPEFEMAQALIGNGTASPGAPAKGAKLAPKS